MTNKLTTQKGQRRIAIRGTHLCKHVAGREGHLVQSGWVPGRQDDAAVAGVGAQLVHHLRQLVHSLRKQASLSREWRCLLAGRSDSKKSKGSCGCSPESAATSRYLA